MSYPLGSPNQGYAPKEVYDFWLQLLNSLLKPTYLWRVVEKTSLEPGLIMAYKGYNIERKEVKKVSTSLIPGCYVVGDPSVMSTCLKFRVDSDPPENEVMAVSYTHDALLMYDPITGDDVYPQELEVGIYGKSLPVYPLFVHNSKLNNVVDVYLNPEANYPSADRIVHELLSEYIGVGRKYYTYDRLAGDLLYSKYLTLVIVADLEHPNARRITYDFAEVWDWFWSLGSGERYYPLNASPDFYGKAVRTEGQGVIVLNRNQYMSRCRSVTYELHIPESSYEELCSMSYDFYIELLDYYRRYHVPEKRLGFYHTSFVGSMHKGREVPDTPLGRRAERIYRMYPQYFDSPREVYLILRWKLIYDYMPDDLIAKHLIELKKTSKTRGVWWRG